MTRPPAPPAFLWTGRLEGVSYLVLLGIAMPLKYLADAPAAVRITGAIHGALFVAYVVLLVWAGRRHGWSARTQTEGVVASLLPFGVFWFERRLQRGSSV